MRRGQGAKVHLDAGGQGQQGAHRVLRDRGEGVHREARGGEKARAAAVKALEEYQQFLDVPAGEGDRRLAAGRGALRREVPARAADGADAREVRHPARRGGVRAERATSSYADCAWRCTPSCGRRSRRRRENARPPAQAQVIGRVRTSWPRITAARRAGAGARGETSTTCARSSRSTTCSRCRRGRRCASSRMPRVQARLVGGRVPRARRARQAEQVARHLLRRPDRSDVAARQGRVVPARQNDYEVQLVAAHEAYPGHHTQFSTRART